MILELSILKEFFFILINKEKHASQNSFDIDLNPKDKRRINSSAYK
jgi:hypothetical protein